MKSPTEHVTRLEPRIAMREVEDVFDAEDMRLVRNQVAQYMTHNNQRISRQDQCEWYRTVYTPLRDKNAMVGFVLHKAEAPVGYGLVSRRHGVYWVSGGLVKEVRGKGEGERLFSSLTEYVLNDLHQDAVYLDVQKDNERAIGLYQKLGYVALDERDDLLIMGYGRPANAA